MENLEELVVAEGDIKEVETHKIPKLGMVAFALKQNEFQTEINALGDMVTEALGLDPDRNWIVDFTRGIVTERL